VAAVPLGLSEAGLPVGAQLAGPYLGDRTVVDLAGRIGEALRGFGGYRRPPGY
jgi:amidase